MDANDVKRTGGRLSTEDVVPLHVARDADGNEVFAEEPEPMVVRSYSVISFEDREPKPGQWLIPGWLPLGECVMVAGEMKTSKTWLVFLMALCVAHGKRLLGKYKPWSTGPVLIYSPESSWESKRRRMYGLCWGHEFPHKALANIKFVDGQVNLGNSTSLARLKATVDEVKPLLLVLDPLINCAAGVDENKAGEMQALLNSLRDLSLDNPNMTTLLVHHLGKDTKGKSNFHALRGSSALGGWADGLLSVSKLENKADSIRKLSAEFRDAPSPAPLYYALVVDQAQDSQLSTFYLEPCDPPADKVKPGRKLDPDLLQRSYELIRDYSGTLSKYKGADRLKVPRNKFNRYYAKLEEQGRVKLDAKGHMVLV